MPLRLSRMLCLTILICSAALPRAAATEPVAARTDWILQALARPVPTGTPFVELRGSPMLKEPMRVEGEYRRPDATTLVREVRAPYAETSTIRDGEVTVARSGKPPRKFALARSPELAGIQASFGALLAGDQAALERAYKLSAEGVRGGWTLRLVPRDARVAASIGEIALYGQGDELRCIETHPVKGDPQRTLMAGAVRAAAGVSDATALAALCHAGAAR